jgi:hypothetical protein
VKQHNGKKLMDSKQAPGGKKSATTGELAAENTLASSQRKRGGSMVQNIAVMALHVQHNGMAAVNINGVVQFSQQNHILLPYCSNIMA